MYHYKKLKAWQNVREPVRSSAISNPTNIAKGAGHFSNIGSYLFLEIAYASSCVFDPQIISSLNLEFIHKEESVNSRNLVEEIQKMISGLIKSLQKKN